MAVLELADAGLAPVWVLLGFFAVLVLVALVLGRGGRAAVRTTVPARARPQPRAASPVIEPLRPAPAKYDAKVGIEIANRIWLQERQHRRVERLYFPSRSATRRRVSVDLDVTADLVWEGLLAVPLAFSLKSRDAFDMQVFRLFDVRDEAGNAIPLFDRDDAAEVSWSACCVVADRLLDNRNGPPLDTSERARLWQVVAQTTDAALDARHELLAASPRLADLANDEDMFSYMLDKFASEHLFYAGLPVDSPKRRVLKYEYEMPSPFDPRRARRLRRDGAPGEFEQEHLGDYVRRRLALVPSPFVVVATGPLPTRSLHIELEQPDDVVFENLRGRLRKPDGLTIDVGDEQRDEAGLLPRVTQVRLPDVGVGDSVRGYAQARPRRSGDVLMGSALGLLLAVVFTCGAVWPDLVLGSGSQPAEAILLLLPAAFIGWLAAARSEHDVVQHLLRIPRRLVAAAAAAAALGVLALLVTKHPSTTENSTTTGAAVKATAKTAVHSTGLSSGVLRVAWAALAVVCVAIAVILMFVGRPSGQRRKRSGRSGG